MKAHEVELALQTILAANPWPWILCEKLITPRIKSPLSPRRRNAAFYIYGSPGRLTKSDRQLKTFDLHIASVTATNTAIKFSDSPLPISFIDHTAARFVERSDDSINQFFRGLMPFALALFHVPSIRKFCPFPIAIPHAQGMMLGEVVFRTHLYDDYRGQFQYYMAHNHHSFNFFPHSHDGNGRGHATVIRTFVETSQLFPAQVELRSYMMKLFCNYSDDLFAFNGWNASMAFADEGDATGWEIDINTDRVSEFESELRKLTESELWNSTVRQPPSRI